MRDILFRGKLTANGKWSEGNLVVNKRGVCVITPDETPIGTYGQVIPETVGQYTGLTDKNGRRIFEGDIVNFSDSLYFIIFIDGCFRICRNGQYSYTLHNIHSSIEVIGFMHDNPELLKGGCDND